MIHQVKASIIDFAFFQITLVLVEITAMHKILICVCIGNFSEFITVVFFLAIFSE